MSITGKFALLLFVGVLLTACGGGGGGSSTAPPTSGQTPTPPPSGPAPPPAGDPPPVGDSSDNRDPVVASADIRFPLSQASTAAAFVTVRGVASNNRGVARVSVGNVVADTGFAPLSGGSPTEVEFVAKVPLGGGRARLPITVEDDEGDTTDELDEVVVVLEAIPSTFALDAGRNRLVGMAYEQRGPHFTMVAVDYDLATDELIVLPTPQFTGLSGWCHAFGNDVSAFAILESEGETALYTLAFGASEAHRVGLIDYDPGPDWVQPFIRGLECAADGQQVFAYYEATSEVDGNVHSALLTIQVQTGAVDVLSLPSWRPVHMTLDGNELVVHGNGPLRAVDVSNGATRILTPGASVPVISMAPDLENGRIFYTQGLDLLSIETGELGAITTISSVPRDHPLAFDLVRSMVFDPSRNRVLMGDEGFDAIIAVDIATGERSEVRARSLGEGPRLRQPQFMVIAEDLGLLYIADQGGNASPRLFEIELLTGARRQLATFDDHITSLALDQQNRVAYVSHLREVIAVDVKSGASTVVASENVGLGAPVGVLNGLLWDSERQQLLIADGEQQSIVAFDPATGLRSVVSKAESVGAGPPFSVNHSMTFAGDPNALFVSNQGSGIVIRVDMATGDRSIFLEECDGSPETRFPGQQESLGQLAYDPLRDRLLVQGWGLFEADPQTGKCVWLVSTAVPIETLAVTSKGELLTSIQRAVVQFDIPTLEHVVLSK